MKERAEFNANGYYYLKDGTTKSTDAAEKGPKSMKKTASKKNDQKMKEGKKVIAEPEVAK